MKRAIILITVVLGVSVMQSCTSAAECGAYAQHETDKQHTFDDVQ